MTSLDHTAQKRAAAQAALEQVESHTMVGLGSGSTAEIFIELLAAAVADGKLTDIKTVSSSEKSAALATELGLEVLPPESVPVIDLNIDGTDETETETGHSVKGGGNALHREKMIALKSKRTLFIAEEKKAVAQLGAFGLPLEISAFDPSATLRRIESILPKQATVKLKKDYDEVVYTDNGNLMAHIDFANEELPDARTLLQKLKSEEGVFSVGLFIDLADQLIIGKADGSTETFTF